VHPPPPPARANFTLMTECTQESSGCTCNSVYSVILAFNLFQYKSFVRKKFDLAIIQEDTIFTRILSMR
jgi:hypothetical protein